LLDQHIASSEEQRSLLGRIVSHSLAMPCPMPQKALNILRDYGGIPDNEKADNTLVPLYLQYAQALLVAEFYTRERLPAPNAMPAELLNLAELFQNLNHLAGEARLWGIYGEHLLKLEYIEGVYWLEKAIQPLWDLGYYEQAQNYNKALVNWTKQRGFWEEAKAFQSKYDHIHKKYKAPFEHKLEKLYEIHALFASGAYEQGTLLMDQARENEQSETFRVSFLNMKVNSAAKLSEDTEALIRQLDELLEAPDAIKDSILTAQLIGFKIQLSPDDFHELYDSLIDLYKQLGDRGEAITQQLNKAYDLVLHKKSSELSPLIDGEVVKAFKAASEALTEDVFIADRLSLEATLYQRWGVVLMLDRRVEEAREAIQEAARLFLQANNLHQYTINTHHFSSTCIELARSKRSLELYDEARDALTKAVELLAKSELTDFIWRMYFNLALALSEPLKYGLIADVEEHRSRFEMAKKHFDDAIEYFADILVKNASADKASRLLNFAHLNKEIRQLIFAGFYFYFYEQDWQGAINWLEKTRARSLRISMIENKSVNAVKDSLPRTFPPDIDLKDIQTRH
jgi:hypothetical protein